MSEKANKASTPVIYKSERGKPTTRPNKEITDEMQLMWLEIFKELCPGIAVDFSRSNGSVCFREDGKRNYELGGWAALRYAALHYARSKGWREKGNTTMTEKHYCCDRFAQLVGEGSHSPIAIVYQLMRGEINRGKINFNGDFTYNIEGGGGCNVVEDAKFCVFCGKEPIQE